jgi:uncharacterized coiled-coil protein SlyX
MKLTEWDPYEFLTKITELCENLNKRIAQQEKQIRALNTCVDAMARQILADHNYKYRNKNKHKDQ